MTLQEKKISLFLMGEKGLAVLEAIVKNGMTAYIDCVVSENDPNTLDISNEGIRGICQLSNIQYYNRKERFEITTEYIIAIAWRWLIRAKKSKIIVLHDSLLPKYRGFAPLVNMLIHREPYIGVTAFFASDEFDRGDIIEQESVKIEYPILIAEAIRLISPIYVSITISIITKIIKHQVLNTSPQNEAEATYSLWRDEDDYRIDWNNSAEDIQQFVYSTGYPYKGACSIVHGEIVRIVDCTPLHDVIIMNRNVGKVLFYQDGHPVVVCRKGLLKIIEMKNDNDDRVILSKTRVRFC